MFKTMIYLSRVWVIVGKFTTSTLASKHVHYHRVIIDEYGNVRQIFKRSGQRHFNGWLECMCPEEDHHIHYPKVIEHP